MTDPDWLEYEYQCAEEARRRYGNAWHWDFVPENVLLECGYTDTLGSLRRHRVAVAIENEYVDEGVDAIAYDDRDGSYTMIQAKHRKVTGLGRLGTFLGRMLNARALGHGTTRGIVFYSGRIDRALRCSDRALATVNTTVEHLPYASVESPSKETIVEEHEAPLYDFQRDAVEALSRWVVSQDRRGVLTMPCGTGKTTVIGNWLRQDGRSVRVIVMLSPLKASAEQNYERISRFLEGHGRTHLLVDSDGSNGATRDVERIRIASRGGCAFLSATFDSADVVVEALEGESDVLVVIDECHNIPRSAIVDPTSPMGKILRDPEWRVVSMSATPRVFSVEGTDQEDEDGPLLGDTIYAFGMRAAIERGVICYYRIWLPDLVFGEPPSPEDSVNLQAMYLVHGMLRAGSRRVIAYLQNTRCMDAFQEAFQEYTDSLGVKAWMDRVTHRDDARRRKTTKNLFQGGHVWDPETGVAILRVVMAIRIWDEAVDLVKCDGVFIVAGQGASENAKVRTVQRVMRGARKDPDNPSKVNHVFLWGDGGVDSLGDLLSGIKEADEPTRFAKKIGVLAVREYDAVGTKEVKVAERSLRETAEKVAVGVKEFKGFDQKLELLRRYVEENGRLPSQNTVYEDEKIGRWCQDRRQEYKKRTLLPDRIAALEEISGWFWERDLDGAFLEGLERIKRYQREHGRLPSRDTMYEDEKIGVWCHHRRREYTKRTLSSDRIAALEEIPGWFWERDLDGAFLKGLERIKRYQREHGRLPSFETVYEDERIGSWCDKRRQEYKKRTLSSDRIAALEEIPGWVWERDLFLEGLERVKRYQNEHGRLPSRDTMYEDENIGSWCSSRRQEYRKGNLLLDRIAALEEIPGWFWDLDLDGAFLEGLERIKRYQEEKGILPSQKTEYENEKIGRWCDKRRQEYRKGTLSSDRIAALEKIPGWFWERDREGAFLEGLERVKRYQRERGCLPPRDKMYEDKRIGGWCHDRRREYKKGTLSSDRIAALEEIPGWRWALK